MPIINCKQCNGVVSEDAEKCPHCGALNFSDFAEKINAFRGLLYLISAGLLLYVAYIFFSIL